MHHRFFDPNFMLYEYERKTNQRIVKLQVQMERTAALNDKLAREIKHLARQNWKSKLKEIKVENMNQMGSPCSRKALDKASKVLQYSRQREIRMSSNSLHKSSIEEAISDSHKRIEKWQQQLQSIRQIPIRLYDSPILSKSDYQFPTQNSHRNGQLQRNEQSQKSPNGRELLKVDPILEQKIDSNQLGAKKRKKFLSVMTADLKKRRAFKENDAQKVVAK